MKAQGELFVLLAVHLALTGLPGIAAALLAARLGVRQVPVLLAIGLAATGVGAMLAFWAYYADPQLGETWSFLLPLGSALLAGWVLRERRIDDELLRRLATPLALWALGAAFVVFLGFLHGGSDTAIGTSATRFSGQLPTDNDIPFFYSSWFFENGHSGTPPEYPGEWTSSDRPPLQIGYVLAQKPLWWASDEKHYQILGVVLQQLWIVGLWALLLAARIGRVTRALTAVTVLVSGLAIVNSFYVWPKLLPAAMLLAAAALVLTSLWVDLRRTVLGASLFAILLGLALLGHGASAFGVATLGLIAAFRGLPSWRWIGTAFLACFLLVAPWMAYQQYGDPPGNRLTKWMLAGQHEIDDRSTSEAIVDGYQEAGLVGTIENKGKSFTTMIGVPDATDLLGNGAEEVAEGRFSLALRELRSAIFLYLLPSLGLLLLAPVLMAAAKGRIRGDPNDWRFSLLCWMVFLVGVAVWGLLMYGGEEGRTIVHQGTYLVPILGMCGAVAGLRAVSPRLGFWFVAVSAVLTLAISVPALTPPPDSSYSLLAGTIAASCLAGFVAVVARAR